MSASKDWKKLLRKAIQRFNKTGKWTRGTLEEAGAFCMVGGMLHEAGVNVRLARYESDYTLASKLGMDLNTFQRIVLLNDCCWDWKTARNAIVAEILGGGDGA